LRLGAKEWDQERRGFQMRGRTILVMVVAGLIVASCGGEDSTDSPTTAATPDTASDPASGPFPEGEPVDFVLLADSGGGGVADLYAEEAAAALDREIRVHDFTTGMATADQILSDIQGYRAAAVAGAELIVFYVHPGGFVPRSFLPCLESLDGGTDGKGGDPPEATTVEDWQGYRDTLDQIYDEIWTLRAGQPTIIRAYGIWLPWLAQWQQMGIDRACVAGEEAVDQARQESAEAHGAIFVSMMDVFAGPKHDEDPIEMGWISEDGMHLSGEGHVVLVDALAGAGFEPSEPPNQG
jgi:hypothetical protein